LFLSLFLLLVHYGVEHLEERGLVLLLEARGRRARSGVDGELHSSARARAALRLLASRALALQLALGLGAVGRLDALVLAVEFLAHRAAFGLGSGASGVALSRVADGLARRASLLLAVVLGAADRANRALAVHDAFSASSLFASHLALRARAHRVADSRALRIIALPAAHGVALLGSRNSDDGQQNDESELHFLQKNGGEKDGWPF